MNKKHTAWAIFTIGIIIGLSYYRLIGPESNHDTYIGTTSVDASLKRKKILIQPPPPQVANAAQVGSSFLPTHMEDPGKFAAYEKQVKDLSECLNMKVGILDPQAEINFEYFNSIISSDLGDIISKTDQWAVTDIKAKNGEIRRIYVEYTVDPESEIKQSTLKYFAFDSTGAQRELPLTPEQAKNPTDTFIAGLESEGDVVSTSFARSILYQNGDELMLVEKNGHIYSYTLPHDGKTFKCTGADSSKTMKCECE